MKNCLVIFAKEPQDGRVKTRLKSAFSELERTNLYKAFLKDTAALVKKVNCEGKVLAYDSINRNPDYLKKIFSGFTMYRQAGYNLGARMQNAFHFARLRGASKVVIIGSDSPSLPPFFIKKAFQLLDNNDIVLGPSIDGGYYLIGMKRFSPGIFDGVAWSQNTTLVATLKNCKRLGKKTALVDPWFDVDDRSSLLFLKASLKNEKDKIIARWTRGFLEKNSL